MKRRQLLVFVLLMSILLLLTSCASFSNAPRQVIEYHKGTKGLELNFLNQAPPREVFEGSEFDVQVFIENQGVFNVSSNWRAQLSLQYDSLEMERLSVTGGDLTYLDFNLIQLAGKSIYFPRGENNYFPLARFKAKEVPSFFQSGEGNFYLQLCYPYKTYFSTEMCIDTTDGNSLRREVCETKPLTFSGGQGAPIAVTAIEPRMIPRGVYVVPQFLVTVRNVGTGMVSAPNYESINGINGCGDVTSKEINQVAVDAILGSSELRCSPNPVILYNGQGKTECVLVENEITAITANYMTTLNVELGYVYTQFYDTSISVKRQQQFAVEDDDLYVGGPDECYPWQEFIPDSADSLQGTCVSICRLKAQDRDLSFFEDTSLKSELKRSETRLWPIFYSPTFDMVMTENEFKEIIWNSTNCIYPGAEECRKNPTTCILEKDLCEPGAFCGWPSCLTNNRPPRVVDFKEASYSLSWACRDPDESGDIARTCGCSSTAYYTVVELGEKCDAIPLENYISVEGEYDGLYRKTEYTIMRADVELENKQLCMLVTDVFEQKAYANRQFKVR